MSPQLSEVTYEHEFDVLGQPWRVVVFEQRWDDQDPREAQVRVALRPPPAAKSGGYEASAGHVDEEFYWARVRERDEARDG